MPSNAMKISQLLARLAEVQAEVGDLDVVIPNAAANRVLAVQRANVTPQRGWPWRSLIRPVLALEPTDEYQATPEADDGWIYDLSAAPEGEMLRVMKRRGGEDTGQRHGDTWSVFEGQEGPKARAWEIAAGGVLAWRRMA